MKTLTTPPPKRSVAASAASRKLFCRIQEVSKITGLKPYVLRYWETEFKELSPAKDASDQRRYRQTDIDIVLAIRKLLYEDRFTIEGARKRLKEEMRRIRGQAANLELNSNRPSNKGLLLDEFIPSPVRRTARRSLAEATAPRMQSRAALMLRDCQPLCDTEEAGARVSGSRQTAAIISIAMEAAEKSVPRAASDPDAQRLEIAMRKLKTEVNELLEILR